MENELAADLTFENVDYFQLLFGTDFKLFVIPS